VRVNAVRGFRLTRQASNAGFLSFYGATMIHSLYAPRQSRQIRLAAAALLLAVTASAPSLATDQSASQKTDARAQLSIGYTILYREADGIPKLKWLLDFKDKTSEMGQLTHDLMSYYQQLADNMKKLSKQYPAMRIDAEAMSPIEAEERKAIGTDQAKDMAPLVGKAGRAFERETLLMFYDALNEQRHLTAVMVPRETSPNLKKFLESTKAQLDQHHAKVGALLNGRYFTH
jgi:hypothetical protein